MSRIIHCLECGKSWTQIVPIEKTTIGTNAVVSVDLSSCWQHREKPTPPDFRALADEMAEALEDRGTHTGRHWPVGHVYHDPKCKGCVALNHYHAATK